jgi:hypothetical protein
MANAKILNDLAESLGIKVYQLEQNIGASNGAIAKAIKGEKDISRNLIEKILKKYPQVNEEWLQSGVGEMYVEYKAKKAPLRDAIDLGAYNLDDPKENVRGKEVIDLGNGKYLLFTTLVPHIASMGYLHGYADPHWLEELPRHVITVDHVPGGVYRTFVARGDSMNDGTIEAIPNGYKVTGRVIDKQFWKSQLHYKKWPYFVIVHKDGITIKQIINHDVPNGTITIHSLNPDKKAYPDQELFLGEVLQLLNVIKVERDIS